MDTPMFCYRFQYLFLIVVVCLCNACRHENERNEQVDALSKGLKDNQARVSFELSGEAFYPEVNVFSGELLANRSALTVTVGNDEGARIIVSFGGDDWFVRKPMKMAIFERGEVVGSVKLGKIVDRKKMVGEGYMLAEGEIAILRFSPDELVMEIKGKAGRYSDFQQPDTLFPVKGMIVYKKPTIRFGNISEKEVFSSTSSNK